MCIAIVKPADKRIPEERIRTCFENNPDGAGFAYVSAGADGDAAVHAGTRPAPRVVIVKGLYSIDEFLAAYREHRVDERLALIHFRITTRGDNHVENCHPHMFNGHALIHNGTIFGLGKVGEGKSDTRIFADMVEDQNIDTLEKMRPMIEALLDGDRMAVLGPDGRVLVFSEKHWQEEDGVLYSNDGYLPWDRSTYLGAVHGPRYSLEPADYKTDDDLASYALSAYGFYWDGDALYRINEHGALYRDTELEDRALDNFYFDRASLFPETEYDWDYLYQVTAELIEPDTTPEEEEFEHA